MTRSLVIQTSFLGDMVLTTPLIAYLGERGPVDVVSTPAAAELLAGNPDVRERIIYDKRRGDRGVGGFLRLSRLLRSRRYDAVYLAQGSVRSGALAVAAGVGDRVGFATSAGRAFYTTRIAPTEGTHHAARLLALGTREPGREPAGARMRPRLYPGDLERARVDAVIANAEAAGDRLIAVAPGSIWATKRWPHFAPLTGALARDWRIVVVGGEADRPLAAEILALAPGRTIDTTGRLSLLASAELIRRAAVLVTNDSLPLHLASAMNTPTVAVFGPTIPRFGFGPLADRFEIAEDRDLVCRPCGSHGPMRCPLGHWRCMREISADAVLPLVRAVLTSRNP